MSFAKVETPVYKVGAVIFCNTPQEPQVLIVRPKAKNAGETAPFVLPRGSRQYRGADGQWHDARDDATAQQHAQQLENVYDTLLREMQEEAGLPRTLLRSGQVKVSELGKRLYESPSKAPYAVHWFVVRLPAPLKEALEANPSDAEEVRWCTPKALRTMCREGQFSTGYMQVVDAALETQAAVSDTSSVVPARGRA